MEANSSFLSLLLNELSYNLSIVSPINFCSGQSQNYCRSNENWLRYHMFNPLQAPSAHVAALHPGGQSGQQISVDCASAHKGLFAGVLVLVLTILSIILFCVLTRERALLQVNSCELALYVVAALATALSLWRMRHLE